MARIGFIRLDHALITALVERWRQETHSFHFPTGESTVTLQDVSVLLGLPVDGSPITGVDHAHPPSMWAVECQRLLGRSPEDTHIRGGRLQIQWLIDNFGELPENATEETVRCYARAYILRLIGGFLMPDKSQNLVKLMFLQFLEDLDCCGAYNWGGAVLATLYRMLCRASKPGDKEIGGPLVLLQIWAWERLPRIAPRRLRDVGPGQGPIQDGDQQLPGGPWGSRWRVGFALDQVPTHVVTVYRDQFNRLTFDEFIWKPYGDTVMEVLPNYCTVGSDIWMAHVPLICFELVEWHLPQRVLRQFGCVQDIPDFFDTDRRLHSIDRRGHHNTDWAKEHAEFITIWEARGDRIVHADRSDRVIEYQDTYMQWYRRQTRVLIGNPSHRAVSGYQGTGGVIEVLTQRVADDYNLADTAEKALRATTTLCPEALHALSSIRDRCYEVLCQVHQQHRLTNEPLTLQPSTSRNTCEDQANASGHTAEIPCASTPLSSDFCNGPQEEMQPQQTNEDLVITNSASQPITDLATTDQATLEHVSMSVVPYSSEDAVMEDGGLTQVDHGRDDADAGGGEEVGGNGVVEFRREEEGEVEGTIGEEVGQEEVKPSIGEGIGVGGEVGGDGEVKLGGKIVGEVDTIKSKARKSGRGRGRGRGSGGLSRGPPPGEGVSPITQLEHVPPKRSKRSKA